MRPAPIGRRVRSNRGFTLLDLLFVVAIMGTVASMALPGLLRARASAGVSSAIGSLRVINSAQLTYAITCGAGFYAPDLVTLGTNPPGSVTAFVSPDLGAAASVIKADFLIQMAGTPVAGSPGGCNGVGPGGGASGYRAGADPQSPTTTRFFATNASGAIYEAPVSLYAGMPEAGVPPGASVIH
jgi:prepilin-type N-terminal cleavage/methylation domain-containing protein